MSVIRVLCFSLMIAIAVACSSNGVAAPPPGFTHAVASAACGPADGPATAIYLAPDPIGSLEPVGVYVRLAVPVSAANLTGRLWPIGANTESAAWLHVTDSNSQLAETGYLIVKSVGPDNTIVGSVDLSFPTDQRVRGGFTATWFERSVLCG